METEGKDGDQGNQTTPDDISPEDLSTDGFIVNVPETGCPVGPGYYPSYVLFTRGEHRHSAQLAREDFLRAIKAAAPEVLFSLAQDVHPLYEPLYKIIYDDNRHMELPPKVLHRSDNLTEEEDYLYCPDWMRLELSKLRHVLLEWATRFNLNEPWLLDIALFSLFRWSAHKVNSNFDWSFPATPFGIDSQLQFKFEYPAWDVEHDDWKSYESKIRQAFQIRLGRYRGRKIAEAQREGKRPARKKQQQQHFIWLVKFQIKGESMVRIAREAVPGRGVDRSSVSEAVNDLASLIGLKLRPHRNNNNE